MKIAKKLIPLSFLFILPSVELHADNYEEIDPEALIRQESTYVETMFEADKIAKELEADGGVWSDWATGNPDQDRIGTVYCDEGSYVIGIEAKDQGGYGLIDIRIRCGLYPSAWAIGNNSQAKFQDSYTDGTNAYGMEVKDQGGYGLVDGLLVYGSLSKSKWLSGNPSGVVKRTYCPRGTEMAGLQAKDQGGYGLIDVRLYCRPN